MNHIYRLVFSELTRTWVAVAETTNGRGKRASGAAGTDAGSRSRDARGASVRGTPSLRLRSLAAALALAGAPAWALDPSALPTSGKVVAGSAAIGQTAKTLTVQQMSQRAALDWQSFNIGAVATVQFNQPNSSAVAMNRILGNDASQIYGKLSANGQVFFTNPNGMLFARGAEVNVGGILATTLSLSNDDFMAGNYRLSNPGGGVIRNEGVINVLGNVALVGNSVQNAGSIVGTTDTLAAGDSEIGRKKTGESGRVWSNAERLKRPRRRSRKGNSRIRRRRKFKHRRL